MPFASHRCFGSSLRSRTLSAELLLCSLSGGFPYALAQPLEAAPRSAFAQTPSASTKSIAPSGIPLGPEAVANLLPPSVYFRGKSAPVQLRNAGAVCFGEDATVWAALVDTSGYATDVQEKYQFYLVTESALLFGGTKLAAGAYGGGFVGERFIIQDLGGHTVAEGPLQTDPALRRPRPLQMLPDTPDAVKLYLGRHWVQMKPARP